MIYSRFVCSIMTVLLSAQALSAQEPPTRQQVVFHVRLVQATTETQDAFATRRAPRREGRQAPESTADFRQTNGIRAHILDENVDADSLVADELSRTSTEKLHDTNYRLFTSLGRDALLLLGDRFPVPTIPAPEADRLGESAPSIGNGIDGLTPTFFPPLPETPGRPRIEEFGARLAFLPVLLPDGRLRVRIASQMRVPDFGHSTLEAGSYVPAIASRFGHTHLDVKPGQSFAVTGVFNRDAAQKLSRLAGSGRSPLFNRVLEAQSVEDFRALLVIVTPELPAE